MTIIVLKRLKYNHILIAWYYCKVYLRQKICIIIKVNTILAHDRK